MKYFIFTLLLTAVPSFAEDGSGTPIFGGSRAWSSIRSDNNEMERVAEKLNREGKLVIKNVLGGAIRGTIHPNGGGFVSIASYVDPTAYVGKDAVVINGGKVYGNARVLR